VVRVNKLCNCVHFVELIGDILVQVDLESSFVFLLLFSLNLLNCSVLHCVLQGQTVTLLVTGLTQQVLVHNVVVCVFIAASIDNLGITVLLALAKGIYASSACIIVEELIDFRRAKTTRM